MNRSSTALSVLLFSLAASLFAMGQAHGETSRVTPVAYVMILPAPGGNSSQYECGANGQICPREEIEYTPSFALFEEDSANSTAPSEAAEAELQSLFADNFQRTEAAELPLVDQPLSPAPAVIIDLELPDDEPNTTGDLIDWETLVYEQWLAETLPRDQTSRRQSRPLTAEQIIFGISADDLSATARWLGVCVIKADRWLASRVRVNEVRAVLGETLNQWVLERELAELFGETVVAVAPIETPKAVASTQMGLGEIEQQTLLTTARALARIGTALQAWSRNLEALATSDVAQGNWSFPEAEPRSSRAEQLEQSR